jgi:NADPH-dependent FMN reductase
MNGPLRPVAAGVLLSSSATEMKEASEGRWRPSWRRPQWWRPGAAYAHLAGLLGGRRSDKASASGGLGGSLRAGSTSRTALQVGLEGAAAAWADVQLIWVGDLGLPLYTPEHAPPAGAHEFADTVYRSDAMIWSSPTYHGPVSGSFKNALDWLILLASAPRRTCRTSRSGWSVRRFPRRFHLTVAAERTPAHRMTFPVQHRRPGQ